ncbi:MAG: alanine racemase [Acidimicrobiia bacterium]|nr:alanine racemase [Acidimicrobiia bacterium]
MLSEPTPAAGPTVVRHRLTPVVYTLAGVEALAKAVVEAGGDPLPVHLKVDTGMHRVGCFPEEAAALAELVASRDELVLEGCCTHFAVADEPDHPSTAGQRRVFEQVLSALEETGRRPPVVHAANSAAAVLLPETRYDLVRAGIALYGLPPAPALAGRLPLRPALSLRALVSHVKILEAGSRVSYGLRYEMGRRARVATVPIGYADGVPRALAASGGEVLVGGARRPIAGTVTMDQLMVDVGDDPVAVGDEVVLLGRQGGEEITATEWAERVGTIAYEVVCQIGPRVPRRYR